MAKKTKPKKKSGTPSTETIGVVFVKESEDPFFKGKKEIPCPRCSYPAVLCGIGLQGQIYCCTNREQHVLGSKVEYKCFRFFNEKTYPEIVEEVRRSKLVPKKKRIIRKKKTQNETGAFD